MACVVLFRWIWQVCSWRLEWRINVWLCSWLMHRYLTSSFWSLLMTYWQQVRTKLHNNHAVFIQFLKSFWNLKLLWGVNIDHQSLSLWDFDCTFSSRRNSWALQWGGNWRNCDGCEIWGPSSWTAGQQGELLENLYRPSSTTAHGLVFQNLSSKDIIIHQRF